MTLKTGRGLPELTPQEFLWRLASPWEIYRAIARLPSGERGELTREAARILGVSARTVQRRVDRYWPAPIEPQEPGALHEVRCEGPRSEAGCTCREVILAVIP